jgi:putative endopeptidase
MKARFYLAAATLVAATLPLATSPLVAQAAAAAQAKIGTWGVALENRDLSVKPGDDFQLYTSGKWLEATQIPADRPNIGAFTDLRELTQEQAQGLIQNAPAGSKYGTLFASFMDEAKAEQVGLAPLLADLAGLNAISSKADFARYMGATTGRFGISLVDGGPYADTANPEMNVLWLSQGGIGLPDREYYFDAQFARQKEAYAAYITRTMAMIGNSDPAAATDAIMAFETAIAEKSWKIADRRDVDKLNNPMSSTELAAYAPGIEWAAMFEGAGIPAQNRMIVNENTAIRDISALYASTPLATLKLWQAFHIADQAAPYLNKAMVDSRFDYTKSISGVTEQRPRWRRAVGLVDGSLGELLGQDYVSRYFPASSKSQMEGLVANLKLAMADRITNNAWMSAPTKTAALEKLGRMDVMVGYPDKFRNFDGLQIVAGDLYGNVQRASKFNADYAMADLGQPVDRKKWGMNPQTVNAYNGFLENKIVFPAGILQAPFFDPAADPAVNYGAIGAVIGHEISHGFDDQGRKVDSTGRVRDWWTAEDGTRFEAEAKVLGDQYAAYEAAPGAFVNPTLTMGENIADFAGVQVALDAYHKSLNGHAAPVIDGLSGDQRFFLAFAQVWRGKAREDALRNQVATDPHSPQRFRAIGPLRNVEAWYQAFNVQPGERMYITPAARAKIW